jgi:hypothetical protein
LDASGSRLVDGSDSRIRLEVDSSQLSQLAKVFL